MKSAKIYKPLLFVVLLLSFGGFVIFLSASFGVLAKNENQFDSILLRQIIGLVGGLLLMWVLSKWKYTFWKKAALVLFILALAINLLLFIPGLGIEYGGAVRWLQYGFINFQPSELVKIGFVMVLSAWLSGRRGRAESISKGIFPYFIFLLCSSFIILSQNDTETLILIASTGLAMLFVSGAKLKHIFSIMILGLIAVTLVVYTKPYILKRIEVFLDPSIDPQGAGYQTQQLWITVGSGQFLGRGFGQSIQKYKYLPEPIGDSIYAVAAEEFGFVGSISIIIAFLFFGFMGLRVASKAPDDFGRLLALGIVILITAQAMSNMASMIGIFPIAGVPLLFISHGGTALILTLAEVGILLNISRHINKR